MAFTNKRGLPQAPQYVSPVNRTNSLLWQVRIMHSLKSMHGSVLVGHGSIVLVVVLGIVPQFWPFNKGYVSKTSCTVVYHSFLELFINCKVVDIVKKCSPILLSVEVVEFPWQMKP